MTRSAWTLCSRSLLSRVSPERNNQQSVDFRMTAGWPLLSNTFTNGLWTVSSTLEADRRPSKPVDTTIKSSTTASSGESDDAIILELSSTSSASSPSLSCQSLKSSSLCRVTVRKDERGVGTLMLLTIPSFKARRTARWNAAATATSISVSPGKVSKSRLIELSFHHSFQLLEIEQCHAGE